jgi:alkaline phosphatase D
MTSPTRRFALKLIGLGAACLGWKPARAVANRAALMEQPVERWSNTHDRVWLGENVWANPMEDWRLSRARPSASL